MIARHDGVRLQVPAGFNIEEYADGFERPRLVVLPAHVAGLDSRFYIGTQFPARHRNGAFLALHGSWNRAHRIGYSVVFVPFEYGKPSGKPEDFLTGFLLNPAEKEVWGRPAGLLPLTDGSLLASDDGGNKLWRIR